ncbi:MAG: SMP-30/gluconolactonase/LRE family protein [Bacteroidota bacterium]
MKQPVLFLMLAVVAVACNTPAPENEAAPAYLESRSGAVERIDPALDALIDVDAPLEVLAEGFEWSEGPVWVAAENHVLFTDIPRNTIYQWSEDEGLNVFLRPAGYNRDDPQGKELGANGLLIDSEGRLVMCNHGFRAVTRLDPFNHTHTVLADSHDGKRLNSPNDGVFKSNGALYFTDPSYGLEGINNSPHKEQPHNGVYRLDETGEVTLLTTQMTNPNGIGFSPDESVLYVAQSDYETPVLRAFDVQDDGTLAEGRLFYDAAPQRDAGGKGLPDGLAVDQAGNVFATGPGGVLIINPEGKLLGTIQTGEATANCAFGDDGRTLYITADMYLMRIRLKTKGLGF